MGLRRRISRYWVLPFLILGHCGLDAPAQAARIPDLPSQAFNYFDHAVTNLPQHFRGGPGSPIHRDNTPVDNQITNPGATLGRVLFYDKRLSHNNSTACASCHAQQNGFADERQFSLGADGGETGRHSMALTNTKFYASGKMFWDERADSVEDQVLMPIQDPVEMGMNLDDLTTKLASTSFYGDLFTQAFGSSEISSDRISKALAQFVRSLVSYDSKFDSAHGPDGFPDFPATFTAAEISGHDLFNGAGRCSQCHRSTAQVANTPFNNGLDAFTTDPGAGDGAFKTPSLRNIELRQKFMHDGRFSSLEEVIDFYSTGVQDNPNLDIRLQDANGDPIRLNLTQQEKDDLVAFLRTLTDNSFLTSEMFADPFGSACDFDGTSSCDISDLNLLLAEGPLASGVTIDAGNEIFDLNGDGQIDNSDVSRWLAGAAAENGLGSPYIVGDANLDGLVDVSDFNAWNTHRFTNTTDWNAGDFNGDGVVDVSDFVSWNENKFTASDSSPDVVPEPTGLWRRPKRQRRLTT